MVFKNADSDVKIKQKYLGNKGMIALIVFLTAFIPLSTDLYLPALPKMSMYFNAPLNLVNLTLILFFIFFAVGSLFWGPVSDKYGRRPVLLTGLALFSIASAGCACAESIYQLIFFRILQAIGAGSPTAIATALVKDIYGGHKRESILAVVQSMAVIIPIVAPSLGALVLQFTSWRGIFWMLSVIGIIIIIFSIMLTETLDKRYPGTIFQTIGRLGIVLKNPGFAYLLITFSLIPIPMMAFLASSSYIFINKFGLSEQVYGIYFAVNAIFASAGPFIYLALKKKFRRGQIIMACFILIILSGILIYSLGYMNSFMFIITLIPSSIFLCALRPPGINLMLEQQKSDTGSASSLILCFSILTGCLGMLSVSFNLGDMISIIGILSIIIGIAGSVMWLFISGKSIVKIPEPAG